jgi:hypothetical protein
MQAASPPLDHSQAAAPARLPLRRRLPRRAALAIIDLAATLACATVLLKALL